MKSAALEKGTRLKEESPISSHGNADSLLENTSSKRKINQEIMHLENVSFREFVV